MDLIRSLSLAQAARKKGGNKDDDLVDRMNHSWTVGILVLFAVVVSTSQYVGEPIQCWCPAQFTDNYIDYTNKVCWVSNTYYIPMQDRIPDEELAKPHLTYYQWTPFIMLFQAVLFYMPNLIWRALNDSSGLNVSDMVGAAEIFHMCSKYENRENVIKFIVKHMDRYLELRRRAKRLIFGDSCFARVRRCCSKATSVGRKYGNFLVALYLSCKLMYVVNAIIQMFILNYFLGTNFHMYGIEVMQRMAAGDDMRVSEQFPRVTLCDFEIRELGKVAHTYTVQCVLPINLFNEKIFIFLWFWVVFVTFVTSVSFLQWLSRCLFKADRLRYVRNRIGITCRVKTDERALLKEFTHEYLMEDGLFSLRMVSKNSSDIVCAEIMAGLWRHFKENKDERDKERANLLRIASEEDK